MSREYSFVIAWPPTANTYYRRAGTVIYLSAKGRLFKKLVAQQLKALNLHGEGLKCRLSVTIGLYPPNRRAFDIDNRVKPVLDALQDGGLILDDGQIDRLTVQRHGKDPDKSGYCEILLREVND
ncbi:RusA family crossover junction endodeoxyribonuclease [Thiomicrorhabdus sp. 6S2-11]|uniref:Crossover junction endodeoxyribonuclease rusA n=1 Tax=Thiomicrorhabdus marina TaxID=2818442 RepID=A0ABS3Q2X0_9GAMM|nr:RusA family crossover junction endodeoxyribonuclease [Thiomicrorhabdus marina]MBO1926670.1 RusA family crossover junction endodeoxyribonuclease [Thiomicrorhabdus marina]